jgi:hypothetical protein
LTEGKKMDEERNPDSGSLERLLGPNEAEVSCEQCFELLDQYVELELAGADADAELPGLRTHLRGCSACREDHQSLRALVADGPPDA